MLIIKYLAMKKLFYAMAGLVVVAFAACGPTYDVAQPLDNWKSDKGTVGDELQVSAGETLTTGFIGGGCRSFSAFPLRWQEGL